MDDASSASFGIRVLPKAGYVVVVCNMNEYGLPDPYTFHAGETLYDTTVSNSNSNNNDTDGDENSSHNNQMMIRKNKKELLTFFKEVPMKEFTNHHEFKKRVIELRRRIYDTYY